MRCDLQPRNLKSKIRSARALDPVDFLSKTTTSGRLNVADDEARAYIPASGMTALHFKTVQDVAQVQGVIAIVRNTNTASTPLIQKGCPGKPMTIESHTDSATGVVTAANSNEIKAAYQAGYFVVEADGVARRRVIENGRTVIHELKLDRPFWRVAKNQIIDPELKKPLVGDYDIHGVIDPENLGQNIALVAKNGVQVRNIESPIVRKFRDRVNERLDQDRMLHGAQDQYAGFRGGATVFMPDGRVQFLKSEAEVKGFYQSINRQPINGKYESGPIGLNDPIPVISGLRATMKGANRVIQNQDLMAIFGQLLGAGLQWIGDIGIQRNVENELKTTHAKSIAASFSRGEGVLVIIHLQEWAQEDFNGMRARSLLGVSIQGGANQKAALDTWQRQPRLLKGPAEGWRAFDQYSWIDPPSEAS